MSVMRQRIGEHMVASKRVSAHVYSVDEIDMSKVAALRAKSKDEFEKRHGTKLTFMPFFVKAAVAGLRAYPTLNSSLDGTNIVMHKEINIGIAVALDWGLLVPVVKNADEKNILGIQRTMNDLAERARSKKLQARRSAGEHFFDYQPGRVRRLIRFAGDQPAQRRHSRAGGHRKAAGGDQRFNRHPLHVLRDPVLRSPRGGWGYRPPVPAQGERVAGELGRAHSVAFPHGYRERKAGQTVF